MIEIRIDFANKKVLKNGKLPKQNKGRVGEQKPIKKVD
jgi:hypothetical protein